MAQNEPKGSEDELVLDSPDPVATRDGREVHPEFRLRATSDGLAILLDCSASSDGVADLLARIKREMSALGVVNPPSDQKLEELLRHAAESGKSLVDEELTHGEPAVPPKDATLTWTEDFFGSGFGVDEKTGAVDYRRRDEHRSVEEGQLLARLTHPEEGRPGRDVFGRQIPIRKAQRNPIRLGGNVRVEKGPDALYFYAEKNGRIRFAGDTLAVDDVYTINGDVCMATGHIDHPGALIVNGDVLAGFKVRAEGNIEIRGIVEPTDMEAGGDLIVQGGITGAEGKCIKARGCIHAKYILDAHVEAGEDIVVKTEIIHSKVTTRGAVVIPAGRIIGGKVSALGGVVVGQAGSETQVPTQITVAEDYCLADRLRAKQKDIDSIVENLKKIHEVVDPLLSNRDALSTKKKEIANQLLDNAAKMEDELTRLRAEMEAIETESRERAKKLISIRNKLYSETTLRIDETALHVDETRPGPTQIRLASGKIVFNQI